jgi:hypothetical protein
MHTGAGVRSAIGHEGGDAASFRVADWLGFAAAPTFALMALLTGVLGAARWTCSAQPHTVHRH